VILDSIWCCRDLVATWTRSGVLEIWWQLGLDLVFLCCSLLLLLLVVARDVLGDEHVDDLQRQHRAELLLSHARLNELALSDCAVVVLVHLVECCNNYQIYGICRSVNAIKYL